MNASRRPSLLVRSVFAPALALCVFVQCSFVGMAGSLLVSEGDEARLGAEFDRQLRTDPASKKEYPLFVANTTERKAFQDYVLGLANEAYNAVPKKERPDYRFTFTLIDADVQNAFAVPGGYVYIYTGIIKSMRDEAELMGVLGHEIAHVTRHHYRDALAKQVGLSLVVQALAGEDSHKLTQFVGQVFGTLASLSVSRENETDADAYGTRYTAAAGRNPLGIAKYFGRVKNPGPAWLSTHPAPKNRVETVTAQVRRNASWTALAADSARTNQRERFERMTRVIR